MNTNNENESVPSIYIIGKDMFEYKREQFIGLLNSIDKNREVLNYNVTGILAFTGFTFNSLSNNRKTAVAINLLFIITIWVYINLSNSYTVGFNPESIMRLKISKDPKYFDNEEAFWLYATESLNTEYLKLETKQQIVMRLRNICLILSYIYVVIILVFINYPNLISM